MQSGVAELHFGSTAKNETTITIKACSETQSTPLQSNPIHLKFRLADEESDFHVAARQQQSRDLHLFSFLWRVSKISSHILVVNKNLYFCTFFRSKVQVSTAKGPIFCLKLYNLM